MTPDQAKTLWCPFARATVREYNSNGDPSSITSANRGQLGEPDRDSLCIADRCMAWRWRPNLDDGYCGLVPIAPSVEKAP